MKVKKGKATYSRQNIGKGNQRLFNVNIINVNMYTINNYANCNFTRGNETEPESTKSESSKDLFDELLKGPRYNTSKPSTSSSSENSLACFSKRQDTVTFYKSDAELSISTDVSKLPLFKDSKDSIVYSPNWSSPEPYCMVKNKLVKMKKYKKFGIVKKNSSRVMKKYPVARQNKPLSKVKFNSCTSSTPTKSNALLKKYPWSVALVSPIMPPVYASSTPRRDISSENMFETEESSTEEIQNKVKQSSMHGVTALIEGLGNLEIKTPHHKKFTGEVNCVEEELMLNYCKNTSRVLVSQQSEEPSLGGLQKSSTETPHKELEYSENCCRVSLLRSNSVSSPQVTENSNESGEEILDKSGVPSVDGYQKSGSNTPHKESEDLGNCSEVSSLQADSMTSQQDFIIENNSESGEEISSNSRVSTPQQKRFQEKEESPEGSEPEQYDSRSPSLESKNSNNKNVEQESSSSSPISCLAHTQEKNTEHSFLQVNLEAGKKWRRSLLRQKQPEAKFCRRMSMATDTLVRLIKETSNLSCRTNETKLSYNSTTRLANFSSEDNLFEDLKTRSLPVQERSPEFNLTFSKLNTRRRRNYVFNMNEIPEENSDHSTGKICDKTEFCELESVVEEDVSRLVGVSAVGCESLDDTSKSGINQSTSIFETPPILKMKPEALSAITDRKRSRRYHPRSLDEYSTYSSIGEQNEADESSIFLDTSGQNETSDEENSLFTSCYSKIELEDGLENLNEEDIQNMGKVGFLLRCGQNGPMSFQEAFSEQILNNGKKIGEGVFGEVFMLERPGEGATVIKIIPVEGSRLVNGEPQKHFDEVLSELIITEELSLLRSNNLNCTSGFCELKSKIFLEGSYPYQLLDLWHDYHALKRSDNECPDIFESKQQYLALELAHAGEPVESFHFKSPQEALTVFLQTAFSLAVAECATCFEHRDLHIGNVLVQKTPEKFTPYILNGTKFECATTGNLATIIDYTLSRISFKGDVLYFDLEKDPELFTAKGDYQFDIYRHMRADLNNDWRDHVPKTNVRWLHYLVNKLISKKFKQKKTVKAFKDNMERMARLNDIILDFESASDLAHHLIHTYSQTASLIRII